MAVTSIKSTYSMDVETVRTLERLAQRWSVSKSEVLRRAIHAAARADAPPGGEALGALDRLQKDAGLSPATARQWSTATRAERRSSSSREGPRRG